MCVRKRSSIKIRIPNWEGKEKYMEKGLLCRLCFVVTGKNDEVGNRLKQTFRQYISCL